MRRLTKFALIAALTGLVMLPFVRRVETIPEAKAQGAQDKAVAKPAYLPIPGGDYRMDVAHSVIGFSILHNELALVKGRFKDFAGTIHLDDKDITRSAVEFTAKIESIDTGVEGRDKHLRTADFFDAAQFPEMTFKSTRVEQKGKSYVLHGDLTIKGVTKPVALPFTLTGAIKDGRANTRIGVAAQTKIDRRDFGITWGHALPVGGFDVAHDVSIDLQLEAFQPAPKPAG
jgi:polyisoprenoid-binding protein YceI